MNRQIGSIKDTYTCKVSGETYEYEAQFTQGDGVAWNAHVYLNGELKGNPSGIVVDNTMSGDALRQYISSYIEGIIERKLGIDE